MTSLESALRHIHADLTEVRVAFASIGGLAVSARTEPRFTRDANLAVAAANDAEAEALLPISEVATMASKRSSSRMPSADSRP